MKYWILLFISFASISLFATEPQGYYSAAENKTGDSLRLALQSIIQSHTDLGYSGLWAIYPSTDEDSAGNIWDIYSTCTFTPITDQCGNYSSVCDCYNREHSVPQSWFNEASPMKSDAFHIYPTDGKVNGQRSNYPYGECSSGSTLGGHALGKLGTSTFNGYTGTVFEPVDQYKGDLARTYFYMATCYAGKNFNYTAEGQVVFTSAADLTTYADSLFMKWTREDTISQKEKNRNDSIYKLQGNRNPFIDHPELAEYIWGNKKGMAWHTSTTTGIKPIYTSTVTILPNPATNYISITNVAGEVAYQIYNLQGILISQGQISTKNAIDISTMPNGIYLIKTNVDGQSSMHKIVVNK